MKKLKKCLAIVLSSAILSGTLLGCGNKKEYKTTEVLTNVSFPLQETATLDFITHAPDRTTQEPNERAIFKRLEEKTNVHINWTCYPVSQFAEKKTLVLSKKNSLPDGLFNANMGHYDLLKYAKQGAIIPVEDLIDNYMPNLKKILDENPEYRKLITAEDGHIYSFPWIEQLGKDKEAIQSIGSIPWINKKWLDELGLPIPTTTDEFYNTLKAFKEKKPEGRDDIIPMSFIINGGDQDPGFLLGAFGEGYGDVPDHISITNDKEVIYTATQEGYKEGIKWLNSIQKEGLFDPEAFTQDWATFVAKGKAGRYGVFFTWDSANIVSNPKDYVPLPALKGPDGMVNAVRQNGSATGGLEVGRMVLTSACENKELAAKWIDLMYEPIQSVQNNWGTYGEDGKFNIFELKEDGTLQHSDLGSESPVEVREAQSVNGPLAVLDSYYGTVTTMPDDAKARLDILHSVYVKDMNMEYVYPNIFMSQEDLDAVSKYQADIEKYTNQKKAEWILNGGIDKEWDSYLKKLEEYGLSDYLTI
uniref:extracellular solute-binding protein n=1 Tax=uncultured Tyzzerella sp. TaxID=2321398 RepID=UPI002942F251